MVDVDSGHDQIILNDLEGAIDVIFDVDVDDDDDIDGDWKVHLVMIMMKLKSRSMTLATKMHGVQYSSNN